MLIYKGRRVLLYLGILGCLIQTLLVNAAEPSLDDFNGYKNLLGKNHRAIMELYYSVKDDLNQRGENNFEIIMREVAGRMDKKLDEIYEAYASTVITLNNARAKPEILEAAKTAYPTALENKILKLGDQIEKYQAVLTDLERKTVSEYREGNREIDYHVLARALKKIMDTPAELRAEAAVLRAVGDNKKYFTADDIELTRVLFTRNEDYTKRAASEMEWIRKRTTRDKILAIIKALPDLIVADERFIKTIQESNMSDFQKEVLLHFFELPDRHNVPRKQILTTIYNAMVQKWASQKTGTRYLRIFIEENLNAGLAFIEYDSLTLHAQSSFKFKDIINRELHEKFKLYGDRLSDRQRTAFKLRVNPDGSLNSWNQIQEELRKAGTTKTIERIRQNFADARVRLNTIEQTIIKQQKKQREIKELFVKYAYDIKLEQRRIAELRLNEDGSVNLSWEAIAPIIQKEMGLARTSEEIQTSFDNGLHIVQRRKRFGAFPARLPDTYKDIPFEYLDEEGKVSGVQFSRRKHFLPLAKGDKFFPSDEARENRRLTHKYNPSEKEVMEAITKGSYNPFNPTHPDNNPESLKVSVAPPENTITTTDPIIRTARIIIMEKSPKTGEWIVKSPGFFSGFANGITSQASKLNNNIIRPIISFVSPKLSSAWQWTKKTGGAAGRAASSVFLSPDMIAGFTVEYGPDFINAFNLCKHSRTQRDRLYALQSNGYKKFISPTEVEEYDAEEIKAAIQHAQSLIDIYCFK